MDKRRKSDSIAFKLSVAFMVAIIVQSLLLSITLVIGGVIRQSEINAYQVFHERVNKRADNLENEMNNVWTNFDYHVGELQSYFTEVDLKKGRPTDEILEDVAPLLMDALYYTKTSGVFLILDNPPEPVLDSDSSTYGALYLRNANPDRNDARNSNTYLLIGPWNVAEKLKIVTDARWNFRLNLDETNREFYDKPFHNAGLTQDISLLGYWAHPFVVVPGDEPVITYSIPLIDKKGNKIGVFGVEISVSYLYKYLPATDLLAKDSYGYMIGVKSPADHAMHAVVMNGGLQKRILKQEQVLELEQVKADYHLYKMKGGADSGELYACTSKMGMYFNHTPFSEEEWYLIGLMKDQDLLEYPNRIKQILAGAFVISLCVGAVIAAAVGKWFTKYARVIELSEVPIGAYEISSRSRKVFITGQVGRLLDLSPKQEKELSRDKKKFQVFLDNLSPSESDGNYIYCLELQNGRGKRWLRITKKEKDGIIRGSIEDVTDEIIHTKALKLERDYDELANVRNRRAFSRLSSLYNQHLNEYPQIGIIMCDLNELKYVNDVYGHDKGDEYICYASNAICASFPQGMVFRIGGDEFVVLIEDMDLEDVEKGILLLNDRLYDYSMKNQFQAGIAVGYAMYYPGKDQGVEQILSRADCYMYDCKKAMKLAAKKAKIKRGKQM